MTFLVRMTPPPEPTLDTGLVPGDPRYFAINYAFGMWIDTVANSDIVLAVRTGFSNTTDTADINGYQINADGSIATGPTLQVVSGTDGNAPNAVGMAAYGTSSATLAMDNNGPVKNVGMYGGYAAATAIPGLGSNFRYQPSGFGRTKGSDPDAVALFVDGNTQRVFRLADLETSPTWSFSLAYFPANNYFRYIDADGAGNIYLYNVVTDAITVYDSSMVLQSTIDLSPALPNGIGGVTISDMVVDYNGNIYMSYVGNVIRRRQDTGVFEEILAGNWGSPAQLGISEPNYDALFVTDAVGAFGGAAGVYKVNLPVVP